MAGWIPHNRYRPSDSTPTRLVALPSFVYWWDSLPLVTLSSLRLASLAPAVRRALSGGLCHASHTLVGVVRWRGGHSPARRPDRVHLVLRGAGEGRPATGGGRFALF